MRPRYLHSVSFFLFFFEIESVPGTKLTDFALAKSAACPPKKNSVLSTCISAERFLFSFFLWPQVSSVWFCGDLIFYSPMRSFLPVRWQGGAFPLSVCSSLGLLFFFFFFFEARLPILHIRITLAVRIVRTFFFLFPRCCPGCHLGKLNCHLDASYSSRFGHVEVLKFLTISIV